MLAVLVLRCGCLPVQSLWQCIPVHIELVVGVLSSSKCICVAAMVRNEPVTAQADNGCRGEMFETAYLVTEHPTVALHELFGCPRRILGKVQPSGYHRLVGEAVSGSMLAMLCAVTTSSIT